MTRLAWKWHWSGSVWCWHLREAFSACWPPLIAPGSLARPVEQGAQQWVEECNAMMSARIARQPRALGVWTTATCETHEPGGVWDDNVTLNAWSIAEAAQQGSVCAFQCRSPPHGQMVRAVGEFSSSRCTTGRPKFTSGQRRLARPSAA